MKKLQSNHLTSKGENDTAINNKCDYLRLNEVSFRCYVQDGDQ